MAFTFLDDLSTDLAKTRFNVGDIVSGTGVLPDATNIPDATISAAITAQGSVGKASVWLCRRIAARWSVIADSQSAGGRSEANQQAKHFLDLAKELALEYGDEDTGSFAINAHRDDGYHDENQYVEDDGSELTTTNVKYIRVG